MGTLEEIIRDIRSTAQKCYLDTGAMSLMPKTVFETVEDFHESRRRNGPSFAEYWKEVDTLRSRTAQLIGSAPERKMMWLLSVHGELYEMDRRLVKDSLLLPFIS